MNTPSLEDVVEGFLRAALNNVFTALPGRIEHYDAVAQTATVEVDIDHTYETEPGALSIESYPLIQNVPVMFPSFGPFTFIGPISKDEKVLLIFSKDSLDQWKRLGVQAAPLDSRHHAIADAIAITGLRDFKHPHPAVSPADFARIGAEPPGPYIAFRTTKVCLGHENVTDPVARKSDLKAIVDAYNYHQHSETGTTTGAPVDGLAVPSCSPTVFAE